MRLFSALLCLLLLTAPAQGQPTSMVTESPRAVVKDFLQLAWSGRYDAAARYLTLPTLDESGEELARRLSILLEKQLLLDPDTLSAEASGDPSDGASAERLGELPDKDGVLRPITLQKQSAKQGGGWVFSRATVALIDQWYERLERSWLQEHLPSGMMRAGPLGLLWWQWTAALLLLVFGTLFGRLLGWMTRQSLAGLMRSTMPGVWSEESHVRLKRAANIFWAAALFLVGLLFLELSPPRVAVIQRILTAIMFASFFWGVSRFVQALGTSDYVRQWTLNNPSMSALLPLMLSGVRIAILVLTIIVLISGLGYPVASLIAGLGIGGLALALAAQKTGEDLFGSLVIGLDRPFLVGDSVKIDGGLFGQIEAIGLRSTRIRTLDRTLVTIPNGKLAAMQIESFTARDRMRILCVLQLVYGTTAAQLKQITRELEESLRAHPKIWPELIIVRFQEYAAYSLNIEVMTWVQTEDWVEFRQIKEEVLLAFATIVERAGSSFAFPSQTLFLEHGDQPKNP